MKKDLLELKKMWCLNPEFREEKGTWKIGNNKHILEKRNGS